MASLPFAVLVTAVSFNYDLLLERVFTIIERKYCRTHLRLPDDVIRLFKPHGSADFDLPIGNKLGYPLRVYAHMNNSPLRIISDSEWNQAPGEALVVLPFEKNPYMHFQWVRPGYSRFAQSRAASYSLRLRWAGLSSGRPARNQPLGRLHSTDLSHHHRE